MSAAHVSAPGHDGRRPTVPEHDGASLFATDYDGASPSTPNARLSVYNLPWPVPWAALFGREAPLVVEIGFGRGHFLLDLAERTPGVNVVGIEISNRSLSAVETAAAARRLTNVRVVHATGRAALAHLFGCAAIDALHVNFPDPWFKARHAHRRLLAPSTVDLMASRMAPGASLHAATDVVAYAEDIDRVLGACTALCNALAEPWADRRPAGVTTKYEALALAAGRRCAHFHYVRTAAPVAPFATPWPVSLELDMPHAALRSATTLSDAAATFASEAIHVAGCHVHPLQVYHGPAGLLVDTVVIDPTVEQRIAVAVHPRADGAWVVGLATIGQPRPTLGCHLAVAWVARWLFAAGQDARWEPDALSLDPAARALLSSAAPLPPRGPSGSASAEGSGDERP